MSKAGIFYGMGAMLVGAVVASFFLGKDKPSAMPGELPAGPITYSKHIAPIIYQNCSTCHRPGQSGPFNLLTYADVQKRAQQIGEVTESRYMPPWLPDPQYGRFLDERLLTEQQIALIRQWVKDGTPEGNAADLPAMPQWTDGWTLGQPDMVVTLPEAYTLPADGKDVYRNFVLPISVDKRRYVRTFEFRPGSRTLHHAFVRIDRTRNSRALDERDAGPGFDGMEIPDTVQNPDGHFLTWQPGRQPSPGTPGMAWLLESGMDLVVQLHLQTTGKPENVQPTIGLYFTDEPPTRVPFKLGLLSFKIDIPAGEKEYLIKDEYVLPVDAEVLAVLPHAHYLAKEMRCFASLPNGEKQWLFWIKQWDFNWQSDYRFAKPLLLPRGTSIAMEYTFDNSADNPRNPNQPPKRIQYGLQSTDEMGELWIQLLPQNRQDLAALTRDHQRKILQNSLNFNRYRLRQNPKDVKANLQIVKILLAENSLPQALEHAQIAASSEPQNDEPPYYLGVIYRLQNKPAEARQAFERSVNLNPRNGRAHGNLGLLLAQVGELAAAEQHFQKALEVNPDDGLAKEALTELRATRQK